MKGFNLPPKIISAIENKYVPNQRGSGVKAIANQLGVPEPSVKLVVRRLKKRGRGSPQQRGRKRKLSAAEERRLRRRVDKDPFTTNVQLAAAVHDRVTPRSITNILRRPKPPFTRKKAIDQEPEEATPAWKTQVRQFINRLRKHYPHSRRVYADESFLYLNEAPLYGRSPQGRRIYRIRKHRTRKYTLHTYITKTAVLHWELCDENATDKEVERVGLKVARKWKRGAVLIWDRLGGGGRKRNPTAQHYNPKVIRAINRAGGKVIHLPPKGKWLDPCELLFQDLKGNYIRRKPRTWTFNTLKIAIGKYMREVAPKHLAGFYRARADGRDLIKEGLLD